MYAPPATIKSGDDSTYLLDGHTSMIAGTTGGKSTVATNAMLVDEMGVRRKFARAVLYAKSATFDNLPGGTMREYLHSMRNLPQRKKFNPYWLVLLDYHFGRQSTRDWLEIITGE
jgi:hypothetical protein